MTIDNNSFMADKNPHRRVPVALFCTQPAPQPMDLEDDIYSFPPIRVGRNSPPHPESEPPRSRYCRHQASQDVTASRRVPNDENVPPPSTQPRCRPEASIQLDTAAPGGSILQAIGSTQSYSNKVNHLHFSTDLHC